MTHTEMIILIIIIVKAAKIKWIESNAMLSVSSSLSSLTFHNHFWLCVVAFDRDNDSGGGGESGDGKESPHNLTENKAKI